MKQVILAAVLCCAAFPAVAQEADSTAGRVYELAQVETQPVATNLDALRNALNTTYPADRRAAGQGARVSVAFVLHPDGVPRELRVMQSTDAAFDSATVAGVALLRFNPATVGGQPVAVRVEVPVEWRLQAPATAPAPAAPSGAEAPPKRARAYSLGEVDEAPRPTNISALRRELERLYPPILRGSGIQGLVYVRFAVTAAGEVEDVVITRTSDVRFNAVTIQAINVLRFTPARVDGRPVRAYVELPIQWMSDTAGRPQNDGRSPAWRNPAQPRQR